MKANCEWEVEFGYVERTKLWAVIGLKRMKPTNISKIDFFKTDDEAIVFAMSCYGVKFMKAGAV